MTVATDQSRPPHPVAFDVEYPQRVSRLTTFFRLFMAIPQFIVIYLLLMAMGLITILAWFAILFTGRYPKSFFEFSSGVMRWQANVWAYVALLRDEYPPFSLEPGEYPVALDIPLAERQSRFRLFIRVFAIWPNQVVLQFVMYGWFFTTFLSWWMILFTGRYPRGLFRFSVGVLRWQQRQLAYLYLLRDEYPPYSVNANARPGNEVVSLVVGVIGFVTACLSRKDRLPAWARKWLNRISPARITDAIERAAAIAELTPDQRRKQAIIYLQKLCNKELGFPIPASIANLLVEHVYQQWKRGRR